jgi:hypothetical protein
MYVNLVGASPFGEQLIEDKITRLNFYYRINFSLLRKLFALTILRVEFGHFYSG